MKKRGTTLGFISITVNLELIEQFDCNNDKQELSLDPEHSKKAAAASHESVIARQGLLKTVTLLPKKLASKNHSKSVEEGWHVTFSNNISSNSSGQS
jgi:hypothetical protein